MENGEWRMENGELKMNYELLNYPTFQLINLSTSQPLNTK
jgi:hypothetical protein